MTEQSDGEIDHIRNARRHQGAVPAAYSGEFWNWFRVQWRARTPFGKVVQVFLVLLFSWLIALVALHNAVKQHWPDTYKEEVDDGV